MRCRPARRRRIFGWRAGLFLGTLFIAQVADARRPKKVDVISAQPSSDPMEVENDPTQQRPPPYNPPPPSGNSGSSRQNSSQNSSSNANPNENTATPPSEATNEKVGRFMANLKIGPAVCLFSSDNGCPHQGALVIELGYSVLSNKNGYLMLPLQFHFAPEGSAVIVPLGFQYDIPMPVAGLYLYPRISIGYALYINNLIVNSPQIHSGVLIPEFGLKYVYHGRVNIGGEFVSLPIIFGSVGAGTFTSITYRILLSAGLNF